MPSEESSSAGGPHWVIPPEGEPTNGYICRLTLVCISLGLGTYWLLPPEWTVVP